MQTISIGCDHAGVAHREAIIQYLEKNNYIVMDHGTKSLDSVDYPDYAHPVAIDVESENSMFGILI